MFCIHDGSMFCIDWRADNFEHYFSDLDRDIYQELTL